MKINFMISYFYQIRFFKDYQLPISTALWDPKWFHDWKDQDYIFKDKNGVINGIRFTPFNPISEDCMSCEDRSKSPDCCFIRSYKKQLDDLDFEDIINYLYYYAKSIIPDKDEINIVFIVHEKPDNKCSERLALIEWFNEHGIELKEFTKGEL